MRPTGSPGRHSWCALEEGGHLERSGEWLAVEHAAWLGAICGTTETAASRLGVRLIVEIRPGDAVSLHVEGLSDEGAQRGAGQPAER